MAYKPPYNESEFEVGDRVIGKMRPVKVESQRAIKVLWRDDDGETHSAVVLLDECFDNVQEDIMQVIKRGYDGEYQISFSTDKSSIVNFHPANGQFRVKLDSFPSAEDQPPKPKVYTGKYGDMVKFNTVLEIVSPKEVQGIMFPMQLFYEKFVPIETENGVETGFSSAPGRSKHADMLRDFCDATGVWRFDSIEWENNILPELERRISRLQKEFNVVLNGGWVEHIYPIADYDEETDPVKEEMPWIEDDEEEEETLEINQEEEPQEEDEPDDAFEPEW